MCMMNQHFQYLMLIARYLGMPLLYFRTTHQFSNAMNRLQTNASLSWQVLRKCHDRCVTNHIEFYSFLDFSIPFSAAACIMHAAGLRTPISSGDPRGRPVIYLEQRSMVKTTCVAMILAIPLAHVQKSRLLLNTLLFRIQRSNTPT